MNKKGLFLTISILSIIAVITTLYLTGIFSTQKAPETPEIAIKNFSARVTLLIQKAQVKKGKKVKAIKPGTVVSEGEVIFTGKNATVELLLENRFRILIRPNSILQVNDLKEFFQNKQSLRSLFSLNLKKGKAYFKVSRLLKNDRWLLRSPTIQVGVRGTEFVVDATSDYSSVKVKEGRVLVKRNIEVIQELEKEISTELPANRMIQVSFSENEKVKKMIESKKQKLPKLSMEKVSKDPDFIAMDQYFSLNTESLESVMVQINNPEKVMVFLNKTPIGKGNASLFLAPGTYRIYSESLYQVYEKKLLIRKGDSPKTIIVKMKDKKLKPKKPNTDPAISQ